MQRCEFCEKYRSKTWISDEMCLLSSTKLHTGKCRYYRLKDTSRGDYKDAAEFSERVALKIAEAVTANPKGCLMKNECPLEDCAPEDCQRSILKFARLAVEEEMENASSL